MSKIKVFALGGLNENGKNMYVCDVDNNIFIFDAGSKMANDNMLGIDYIIPSFNYIKENIKKIKGIFLTHGHLKSMGAVPDIVREFPNIDIYATKFTCDILKRNLEEENIKFDKLHEITAHKPINFGKLSVFPISLTHSIPDNVGYVLNTPDGAIVYTGSFVFDSSMTGAYATDIGKLAYIGKQGVLCLLSESEYADRPGYTVPNNRVASAAAEVFMHNEGRIIINFFSSQIYRLQELFSEIDKTHRKVIIMGKKLQTLVDYLLKNKYISIKKERIGTLNDIDRKDSIILISNENSKSYGNLERIVNGYDKYIKIGDNDILFFLDPIPLGMEKKAVKISNDASKSGATIVTLSGKDHLLNHASMEDLMLMFNLMNPKYYFPVMGEFRHQVDNANVVNSLGLKKENILLKQNGDVVEFNNGKLVNSNEKIKLDEILIDGKSTQDIGELVLKDRELLSKDGIVIICATLNKKTKEIVAGPEVLTRGFIYVKNNADIIETIKEMSSKVIIANTNNNYVDFNKVKTGIRDDLGRFLYSETECKPMIITVVNEI